MLVSPSASRIEEGAWAAARPAGGESSGAEAAAKREKNRLRMSSFDRFAQRARFFVSRPQLLLLALALSGMPGCGGSGSGVGPIEIGSGKVQGFAGAVATDEPRAALVARDVLSGGGSAVDAAIAGYFTLAVTLPSNAGIGGGGACLVHDAKTKKVEAILFMPQGIPGGQFGVPAAVRGMAYMQARYGRVPWASLVGLGHEKGNPILYFSQQAYRFPYALSGRRQLVCLVDSQVLRMTAPLLPVYDASTLRELIGKSGLVNLLQCDATNHPTLLRSRVGTLDSVRPDTVTIRFEDGTTFEASANLRSIRPGNRKSAWIASWYVDANYSAA